MATDCSTPYGRTPDAPFGVDAPNLSAAEKKMLHAVLASGGLISQAEALALYRICKELPNGARILEIGSYRGASTTAIGHAILGKEIELYCLDCWRDYLQQGFFDHIRHKKPIPDEEIYLSFLKTTYFLGTQLRILQGTTHQFHHLLPAGFFDLIFIDADHSYDAVCDDILLATRLLRNHGLLLGHDYHSEGHGVVAAVNEFISASGSISAKGVIPNTSIWYALIPDPVRELTKMRLLDAQRRSGTHSAVNCF